MFILPQIGEDRYRSLVEQYPFVAFRKEVKHEEMLHLVARSKIYISATQSDGTALSLLEAMRLGAVPLVSNIPSNRSWVVDGLNGYLFNTKESFVQKMQALLSMDERRYSEIRERNRQLVQYRADYQTQMQKIEMEVL
jgi:glycosyltransferase involved in cell wall biosynthesis